MGPFIEIQKKRVLGFRRGFSTLVIIVIVACFYHLHSRFEVTNLRKSNIDTGRELEFRRKLAAEDTLLNVNFPAAIDSAQEVLSLIKNRYELDKQQGKSFWYSANNLGSHVWDIIKYKFATKILDGNAHFLMIFAGSSVTAGHDGYYNESFPYIVLRRMKPILNHVGVQLDVHNIAQGANNCIPYSFCYESMGGSDPDFVAWEQAYNCGHDEPIFELVARLASMSANRAITYYSASGAWKPDKCPKSPDPVPYCSLDWTPKVAGLPEWKPTREDVANQKNLLDAFYKGGDSSKRFASFAKNDAHYAAIGAHGFNVWEPNTQCEWEKKGQHETGCNAFDGAMDCTLKFMTQEASLYGNGEGGAAWHPPRAFHMLRGEAITWIYTLALLDAIYMIQDDVKSSGVGDLKKKYHDELYKLQPPLPSPKKCQSGFHCDRRAVCYTDYRPHYSTNMTLAELIVGQSNWTYDSEPYQDWSLKYGYLDAKPAWYGRGVEAGELHVKVTIDSFSTVWFCGVKESLKHSSIFVDLNVPTPAGGNWSNYSPSDKRIEWEKRKYVGSECKSILELPKGTHVISIGTLPLFPHHETTLSHVIMWD